MTQLALTYEAPRSRRKDPPSSHRAENEIRGSGAMRGQRLICLTLVEQYPGRTSKELAELGTLDRYQLARRLPELHEMHLVRTTQEGNADIRWWPHD